MPGVPPVQARLRAWAGTILAVAAAAGLPVGTALLIKWHPHLRGLAILIFLFSIAPIFVPLVCAEIGPSVQHGPGHQLTVRTITGLRTLDLTRLRSVRHYLIAGRPSAFEMLVVTDARGVRAGLHTDRSSSVLSSALQHQGGRRPRISRFARGGLDYIPRSFTFEAVLSMVSIFACMIVVCVVCVPLALA
jgi:hypothetical protein